MEQPGGPQVAKYCSACGRGLVATAAMCPGCGSPVMAGTFARPPVKSKTTAVLLAVFLSFWTWLYTYEKHKANFWVGLAGSIVSSILVFAGLFASTRVDQYGIAEPHVIGPLVVLGYLTSMGFWLWAVVARAIEPWSSPMVVGQFDLGSSPWPMNLAPPSMPGLPSGGRAGLTIESVPELGFFVRSITPGGAAERLGLWVDDAIISIDGRDLLGGPDEVYSAVLSAADSATSSPLIASRARLEVLREGHTLRLG